MALSLSQELQLLQETENTAVGGLTDFPLSELVYQAAVGRAVTFRAEAKNIDEATHPEAASYQAKLLSVAARVARKDAVTLDTMRKILIASVGDSSFTYAQASGANSDNWEDVLNGSLIAGVDILTVMETAGGVLNYEKTAWVSA